MQIVQLQVQIQNFNMNFLSGDVAFDIFTCVFFCQAVEK